jgi:hypothetical protein
LNRYEYENTLRELLDAPWLQLKTMLPEDGELFRFNKVSEALDVSHVNMARYMQAADYALRQVISDRPDAPASKITRYYAREQASFNRKTHYTVFNRSPERAVFPLIDYAPDLAVLRDDKHPFTVGEANPEQREREAFGVVASSYEPIEPRFSEFKAPRSGLLGGRRREKMVATGSRENFDRPKIGTGRHLFRIASTAIATHR